jgi:hypothetical protein
MAIDSIVRGELVEAITARVEEGAEPIALSLETKANLKREDVRRLAQGGVVAVQPGLESLSTHLLRLMNKGTTLLLNLRLLKWCVFYDLRVIWNMLVRVPNERREDYEAMLALMPLLAHLRPPSRTLPLNLQRSSPMYEQRERLGLKNVRPLPGYRGVYPPQFPFERGVSCFAYDPDQSVPQALLDQLEAAVVQWQQAWLRPRRPSLVYGRTPAMTTVIDTRRPGPEQRHSLDPLIGVILDACGDAARTEEAIQTEVVAAVAGAGADGVSVGLRQCLDLGLVIADQGRYFNIALPARGSW